jgi:isoamylase
LFEFVRELLRLRRTEPVFRRRRFFQGKPIHSRALKDLYWLSPDGTEMSTSHWLAHDARTVAMALPGDEIEERDERGRVISGGTYAILLNARAESVPFVLGARRRPLRWVCVLDTAAPGAAARVFEPMSAIPLRAHSLVVLRAEFARS